MASSQVAVADTVGNFVELATANDDTLCLTVEDKDPKVLWLQSAEATATRFLTMIRAAQRWTILEMAQPELLRLYQTQINTVLPRRLKSAKFEVDLQSLPYGYQTVKRKCYGGPTGGEHTCTKSGHSCLRNIISSRLCSAVAF